MTTENKEQLEDSIEDLTLSETETAGVKGGPAYVDMILKIDGIKGESEPTR